MIYHYTIADRLVKILISRYIKVMEESSKLTEDEICLAWFTKSPKWDNTAFYGYPDQVLDNQGRIRISVKREDHHFHHYKHFAPNMPELDTLERTAIEAGVNPENWVVSQGIVPVSSFHKIEMWDPHYKIWKEVPVL